MSHTKNNKKYLTRKNIKKFYKGMDGYTLETEKYDKKFNLTYGEITLGGIQKLVDIYNSICPIKSYSVERRVFYDLGSGVGKNVAMVASMENILSKGVEIVEDRHNTAIIAYNKMNKSLQSRIEFINGSLFDIPLHNSAWIFVSNLLFSDELNKKLAKKLEKELQKNTLIGCSQEMQFSTIRLIKTVRIPMTWDKSSETYIYIKD